MENDFFLIYGPTKWQEIKHKHNIIASHFPSYKCVLRLGKVGTKIVL